MGIRPDLFTARDCAVAIDLGPGPCRGRTVIDRNPKMREGDVFALNDPYHGGTHLPDITVVTPVFLSSADRSPGFYVASRGHHADIGGIAPGSMPPPTKFSGSNQNL